jgi:PTS system nitrogen regulatory IIA component
MDLANLISKDDIVPLLKAKSKKQVLQDLATMAAQQTGLNQRDVFDTLLQRERLGSTSIGHGTAIPHGKMAGLKQITGVFARLDKPIAFDTIDDEPVDLVFVLLAPESAGAEHLKALSFISRLLRNPSILDRLRSAKAKIDIYSILTENTTSTWA